MVRAHVFAFRLYWLQLILDIADPKYLGQRLMAVVMTLISTLWFKSLGMLAWALFGLFEALLERKKRVNY